MDLINILNLFAAAMLLFTYMVVAPWDTRLEDEINSFMHATLITLNIVFGVGLL